MCYRLPRLSVFKAARRAEQQNSGRKGKHVSTDKIQELTRLTPAMTGGCKTQSGGIQKGRETTKYTEGVPPVLELLLTAPTRGELACRTLRRNLSVTPYVSETR